MSASTRTVRDTFDIAIEVGDTVRVVSWGDPVRLNDTGRLATVTALTDRGNVHLDDPLDRHDPIARGRSVRPGHLAVVRRDGEPGFEGNVPTLVGTVTVDGLLHSVTATSRDWSCLCRAGHRTINRDAAFTAAQTHLDSLKDA